MSCRRWDSLTGRKLISYHFNAVRYGAVAQLAERVARIHEARGSNPLSSTKSSNNRVTELVALFAIGRLRKARSQKVCQRRGRLLRADLRSAIGLIGVARAFVREANHHPQMTKVLDVLRKRIHREPSEPSPNAQVNRTLPPSPHQGNQSGKDDERRNPQRRSDVQSNGDRGRYSGEVSAARGYSIDERRCRDYSRDFARNARSRCKVGCNEGECAQLGHSEELRRASSRIRRCEQEGKSRA